MTERVTVEYNGELITVDVPDGTTDEQIRAQLAGQQSTGAKDLTTAPATPVQDVAERYTAQSALPAIIGAPDYNASQPLRQAQAALTGGYNAAQDLRPGVASQSVTDIGKRLYALKDLSAAGILKGIGQEGLTKSITDLGRFVVEPLGGSTTIGQAVRGAAVGAPKALMMGAMAPENLLSMPYQMAAYEQEKIRANPNAPEYANNPYAMQQRGQAPTQGAAGAMNQRRAVAGQQYGGISAEDQARLEDDKMKRMIRYTALKKALGQ
jgi:hypothetical protein